MNTTVKVTDLELDALAFIARSGGGLGGGRQNTLTHSRLLRKGVIYATGCTARFRVTDLGIAVLRGHGYTAEGLRDQVQCPTCEGQGVCGTQPRDPQQQQIWDCPTCYGTGTVEDGEDIPGMYDYPDTGLDLGWEV